MFRVSHQGSFNIHNGPSSSGDSGKPRSSQAGRPIQRPNIAEMNKIIKALEYLSACTVVDAESPWTAFSSHFNESDACAAVDTLTKSERAPLASAMIGRTLTRFLHAASKEIPLSTLPEPAWLTSDPGHRLAVLQPIIIVVSRICDGLLSQPQRFNGFIVACGFTFECFDTVLKISVCASGAIAWLTRAAANQSNQSHVSKTAVPSTSTSWTAQHSPLFASTSGAQRSPASSPLHRLDSRTSGDTKTSPPFAHGDADFSMLRSTWDAVFNSTLLLTSAISDRCVGSVRDVRILKELAEFAVSKYPSEPRSVILLYLFSSPCGRMRLLELQKTACEDLRNALAGSTSQVESLLKRGTEPWVVGRTWDTGMSECWLFLALLPQALTDVLDATATDDRTTGSATLQEGAKKLCDVFMKLCISIPVFSFVLLTTLSSASSLDANDCVLPNFVANKTSASPTAKLARMCMCNMLEDPRMPKNGIASAFCTIHCVWRFISDEEVRACILKHVHTQQFELHVEEVSVCRGITKDGAEPLRYHKLYTMIVTYALANEWTAHRLLPDVLRTLRRVADLSSPYMAAEKLVQVVVNQFSSGSSSAKLPKDENPGSRDTGSANSENSGCHARIQVDPATYCTNSISVSTLVSSVLATTPSFASDEMTSALFIACKKANGHNEFQDLALSHMCLLSCILGCRMPSLPASLPLFARKSILEVQLAPFRRLLEITHDRVLHWSSPLSPPVPQSTTDRPPSFGVRIGSSSYSLNRRRSSNRLEGPYFEDLPWSEGGSPAFELSILTALALLGDARPSPLHPLLIDDLTAATLDAEWPKNTRSTVIGLPEGVTLPASGPCEQPGSGKHAPVKENKLETSPVSLSNLWQCVYKLPNQIPLVDSEVKNNAGHLNNGKDPPNPRTVSGYRRKKQMSSDPEPGRVIPELVTMLDLASRLEESQPLLAFSLFPPRDDVCSLAFAQMFSSREGTTESAWVEKKKRKL
eukprot:Rmarinus@m.13700